MSGQKKISILALGDSYTVGESIPLQESWPYQLQKKLEEAGFKTDTPEVIAQTGWTTDELMEAIRIRGLVKKFDIVFLLIGVNNQYRGLSPEAYREDLMKLLAIASGHVETPEHIVVISIPDWGNTPFAAGKDIKKISGEIDAFNAINKHEAEKMGAHHVYITDITRQTCMEGLLAEDKLHPSGQMYALWIPRIMHILAPLLKNIP